MLALFGRLGSAIFAFARYRVSTLGVRKFMGEVAGLYAIDEVVDLAAQHSDWVKDNSDTLKLSLGASVLFKNTLIGSFKRMAVKGSSRTLFSKISLARPLQEIEPWVKSFSTSALQNGLEIAKNGKLVLRIVSDGGKIAINHKGSPAVGAILAAALGGQIPATRQEWLDSANQLAVQLADVDASVAEAELRSELYSYAATNLLHSGKSIVSQFLRKYPSFSEERAVSMLMEVMFHEDIEAGNFLLDAFMDEEEELIIRVNGSFFKREEKGDSYIWAPVSEPQGERNAVPEDLQEYVLAFEGFLEGVTKEKGLSLARMANTSNFLTPPFVFGSTAISMVMNLDDPVPHFVTAKEGWIDDGAENIVDTFEETTMSAITRWVSDIPEMVGVDYFADNDMEQKIDLDQRVKAILPMLGATYRNGIIRMDEEDLVAALGK